MRRRDAPGGVKERGQLELFAARLGEEPVMVAPLPTTDGKTALAEVAADQPPDQDARDAIAGHLDRNLLVEAGAGAGKTTEMVTRMVALVRSGKTTVERIAAVTFTRKAAAELRERFQTVLEGELRRARDAGDDGVERIDRALRHIDRAFIGTIHSFCARLLRERPLDAGLDPGFRETLASEKARLTRDFWNRHIERLAAEGAPSLGQLDDVGLQARQLYSVFEKLTEYPDVEFPAEPAERPDPSDARTQLEALLGEARELMPRREPDDGWDELQRKVRSLSFHQSLGWSDDRRFLEVLSQAFSSSVRSNRRDRSLVKRKCWEDGDAAMRLGRRLETFVSPLGLGGRLLLQWYAHRYPLALGFALDAARQFEAERRRRGTLFFEDLLMLSAKLLRQSATAREELAARYPYLLVDEFQDTDPLQAEVIFLLAGDPERSEDASDWRRVVPRPGALFVVGDPKQSIYRFRRADISLYNQVKRRFRVFGDVVELTSNFRSGPLIGRFVNDVFRSRFAREETEQQAPFAPMRVRRETPERHAVSFYALEQSGERWTNDQTRAQHDAIRVASWIAAEVESGARKPGDFMVLTHRKKFLELYAQAVEQMNLPVQVTGAGIGIETDLRELQLLLEALADPGDARLTVAALVGLFFGLDYEQLAAHVLENEKSFSFLFVPDEPKTPVEHALATLNEFWKLSRREPADVVVARIVDRLGLLPFAASNDLADSRAGALLFVLETVRAAALNGEASLKGALDAISIALDTDEAEAPLVPARDDVVRIMNLHQAKGLESPVVVLAEPFGEFDRAPVLHVRRGEAGRAIGYIHILERSAGFTETTLARPLDWDTYEAEARRFEEAEDDRKLYVAATRARDELLVGSYLNERGSPWRAFFPYMLESWPRRDIRNRSAPERDQLEVPAADLEAEVEAIDARRRSLAEPTYVAAAVKHRVQETVEAAEDWTAGRGPEWGTAVHEALEAVGRGMSGTRLRAVCRALLLSADRPLAPDGEPRELDELMALVESVAKSDVWVRAERARASGRLLVEVPFAVRMSGSEYGEIVARATNGASSGDVAPEQLVEGVIDLAFLDEGGWVIADYKSDVTIEPARLERYRAQVGMYAAAWERLTGQPVRERVILFTADGQTASW